MRPARAWAITLVATATMAVSYLDRQVLGVLAPSVRDALDIDAEQYGWLASGFSWAYLLATPIAGRLLERVGIRRGLLVAVVVWSLVSASHALATSFATLFLLRLALGIAEAPSFPGSAAAISRVMPEDQRPRGLGVLYTGTSLGSMLAPPLAAGLAAWLGGWRFGFLGVALIGLVWVPLWLAATGSSEARRALDADVERVSRPPLLAMLRRPAVLRAGALVLASSPIFAFYFLFAALFLHDAHGVSQEDVGAYLWLPPLFLDLGAVAFGFLASAHARRAAGRSPIVLAAVAMAMTACIAALPLCDGPWQATALLGFVLAGGGGLFAILTADLVRGVGPELAASAGGLTAAAQSIAYVVASPLIGRSAAQTGDYDLALAVLAIWLVPGAIAWIAARPRAA